MQEALFEPAETCIGKRRLVVFSITACVAMVLAILIQDLNLCTERRVSCLVSCRRQQSWLLAHLPAGHHEKEYLPQLGRAVNIELKLKTDISHWALIATREQGAASVLDALQLDAVNLNRRGWSQLKDCSWSLSMLTYFSRSFRT